MLLIKFIITLQNFFVADVSTNIYIGVAITNEIMQLNVFLKQIIKAVFVGNRLQCLGYC